MVRKRERCTVKIDSKMKKPLNSLSCDTNIFRSGREKKKCKVHKRKKKRVVGCGGTQL